MCVWVFCHLYASSLRACSATESGRGHQSPRTGAAGCCKLPWWDWEPNLGPLEEQTLSSNEPSLQSPLIQHFKKKSILKIGHDEGSYSQGWSFQAASLARTASPRAQGETLSQKPSGWLMSSDTQRCSLASAFMHTHLHPHVDTKKKKKPRDSCLKYWKVIKGLKRKDKGPTLKRKKWSWVWLHNSVQEETQPASFSQMLALQVCATKPAFCNVLLN